MFGVFNSTYMNVNLAITMTCMVNSTAVSMEKDEITGPRQNISMWTDDVDSLTDTCSSNENGRKVLDYGGIVGMEPSRAKPAILGFVLGCHRHRCALDFPGSTDEQETRLYSFIYPCINTIVTNWFPIDERSTAVALFTTGNQVALFLGNPLAATLCDSTYGWPAVYYISAAMGATWCVLWMLFSSTSPDECRVMNMDERKFLKKSAGVSKEAGQANGMYSSLPMMFNFVFKLSWGVLVDRLKRRRILTPTQGVKISHGAYTSLLSLAPRFTPTLSSISVSISMLAQLTTPFTVAAVISTGTAQEWNNLFLLTSLLCIVSGTVFSVFGS
ncbi:hypothetical protein OSTOST_08735, partial [Ostertagia ostertagi]